MKTSWMVVLVGLVLTGCAAAPTEPVAGPFCLVRREGIDTLVSATGDTLLAHWSLCVHGR